MMEFTNGTIYKRDIWIFVLIYIHPKWGMLHINKHINKNMSSPMFQHDENGKFQFTEEELIEEWDADNWIILDKRLIIEKINEKNNLKRFIKLLLEKMSYLMRYIFTTEFEKD